MTTNELLEARREISAKLKEKRVKAGLSRLGLSNLSGLCRATIVTIETGTRPWSIDSQVIYENAINKKAI